LKAQENGGRNRFHADDFCIGRPSWTLRRRHDPASSSHSSELEKKIEHLEAGQEQDLTWSWCDACSCTAILSRMSAITGDRKFIDAMDKECGSHCRAVRPHEHLFYREALLSQKSKTATVFWSGNGWVLGPRRVDAHATDYPTRSRTRAIQGDGERIASFRGTDSGA